MKYIAFIGFGVVLLLTICGVVLWANMPTARLTVKAVRPMGTNFIWARDTGRPDSCPVWEVAITNTGRAPARWSPAFRTKDSKGVKNRLENGRGDEI